MFLATAIILGFLGSFHCIGMCGPIALAVPVSGRGNISYLKSSLTYNSGRIFTYSLIGFIAGMIGYSIAFAGYQDFLSIILGTFILAALIIPRINSISATKGFIFSGIGKLKSAIRKQFSKHSYCSIFLIGILNGLLPCGLVYMGIAGSLTSGSTVNGMLFMAAFGIGTVPVMVSLGILKNRIDNSTREKIRMLLPYMIALMGILLILRGMHLDIPYISPAADPVTGASCCHPH